MKLKQVGKSKFYVCPVGQGTLLGRSHNDNIDEALINKKVNALSYGIDLGMNFIDTGEDYEGGLSEKLLSRVIKNRRKDIFIGSKFKPINNSFKRVITSVEGSLKRMNIDYIDLYQIQWPNPKIHIEETIMAFEKLIQEGKILLYGVGNFSAEQIKEVKQYDNSKKFSAVQTEYDLFNRQIEKDILPFNFKHNLSTIAYMSLGKDNFNEKEKQLLTQLSEKYQKTIRSIVLSWIISHEGVIVLTSSLSQKHTLENYEASLLKLEKNDINQINHIFIRQTEQVLPDQIKVLDYDESDNAHLIYTTLDEAIENRFDIQPSAEEIAEEIKKTGKLLRPIELKRNDSKDPEKPYVLVRGRMRFWGWLIAYGYSKKIDSKIFE